MQWRLTHTHSSFQILQKISCALAFLQNLISTELCCFLLHHLVPSFHGERSSITFTMAAVKTDMTMKILKAITKKKLERIDGLDLF